MLRSQLLHTHWSIVYNAQTVHTQSEESLRHHYEHERGKKLCRLPMVHGLGPCRAWLMSNNSHPSRVHSIYTPSLIIFKVPSKLTFHFLRALVNEKDRMPESLKIMSLKTSCRDSRCWAWSREDSRKQYNLFQKGQHHIRLQESSGHTLIIFRLIKMFLKGANSGVNTAGQV